MDEKKENGKDEFDKMFFLLLMLFLASPEEEKEKFLQKMKEIEQNPDRDGGD